MRKNDTATLFYPAGEIDFSLRWKPFLLQGIKLERTAVRRGENEAVLYIICGKTKASSGGEVAPLPDILPGCLVLEGDRCAVDPTLDRRTMKVISVEKYMYGSEAMWHYKLILR